MSWMRRRGQPATTNNTPPSMPAPPVPMYDPNQHNQHSTSTQDWQQQQPVSNNWYNQNTPPMMNQQQQQQQPQQPQQPPTANYWQNQYQPQPLQPQQQQQPQQQPLQQQQQQHKTPTQRVVPQPQQPQQQPQYNQYQNQYSHYYNQQQGYSNNVGVGQGNNEGEPDTWGNWGWGDEDNSNVQQPVAAPTTNNWADSFANDESWNWSSENKALKTETNVENIAVEAVSLNQVQGMPTGKRLKNEHLTPQWSIESQVSQESSDDIPPTSESEKLFSRSSTISHSPVSGQATPSEPTNAQYMEVKTEEENREIVKSENVEVPVKQNTPPPPPTSSVVGNPYKRTTALSHKAIKNSFTQNFNQSVNLETVPDNSEQPDIIPVVQYPDNNEVAPINDRNQYLETGQLSDENNTQKEDLPPPGLSRMVLGQLEHAESSAHDTEPPPGLSRMVLGQTEAAPAVQTNSPPAGLHRMIPGESSSPETNSRYRLEDDYTSEPEAPPTSRSATIGADTPPAETVERRDSIEGQQQGTDIDALTTSVRDLVVGENTTDVNPATNRNDTSDSDPDHHRKSPQHHRTRGRYTPDYPRDKRSSRDGRRYHRDRYYEDDTDYYSDKDRERRRDDRDRRDDYDKKYNSWRKEKERRRKDGGGRERDPRDGRDPRDPRDGRERDPRDVRDGQERDGREVGRDGRVYRDRRDYYYNQYEDNYEDVQRSRPSSRSDSMHESYRDRPHDRKHRSERDHRDRRRHQQPQQVFNPYSQGFTYDAYHPYYQQYQYYLENLRRTDPQAYADWYRKYYQRSGQHTEDKSSVHSGRSSANDDLTKERYLQHQGYYSHANTSQMSGYYREQHSTSSQYGMDDSSLRYGADSSINYEEANAYQRLTPAKFSTAHVKASISAGRMVKVSPHYPSDGQQATVEVSPLDLFLQGDDELEELRDFPGPLIKGVTHKKTIIEYCENKIRRHGSGDICGDSESYVLMWELLILLLRQNGMVVGTDIAELLMKGRKHDTTANSLRPPSVASNNSSGIVDTSDIANEMSSSTGTNGGNTSALKEEYVTNKFREFLLYGSGKEALEWAMKHSLWGHALFLASKLDKRTYANVMMRFANGLPMNDPLQTLYQLLSGRLPASVTSVYDEKWGDWRPHLAMILSNTTQRPELDRKAITTLADTLMLRGSLYAAQFCYLMAEIGFSKYGVDGAKLVLLGGNHTKVFKQFATNEAIHMTEIYEYACGLNDTTFSIPEFQVYKYIVATRLADRGYLETSLAYLEQVAGDMIKNPSIAQPSLINKVCDLADRLKYYDPIVEETDDNEVEVDPNSNRPDNSWLKSLKDISQEYNMGLITHESINNLNIVPPDTQPQSYDHSPQDPWQASPQQVTDQESYQQSWSGDQQLQQQPQQQNTTQQESLQDVTDYNNQMHWNNQQPQNQWNTSQGSSFDSYQQQQQQQPQTQQDIAGGDFWGSNAQSEEPRPQISMPNQSVQQYPGEEDGGAKEKKPSPAKQQPQLGKKDDKTSGTGWFGGIFSRLALRPKNQMKLPDDKNPTIVWDQEKKRWVNLEEDANETTTELKPPPKMMDMMPKAPQPVTQQHQVPQMNNPNTMMMMNNKGAPMAPSVGNENLPPSVMQPNMFKMQRNRNLKKSYVDVFNPGGATSATSAPSLISNTVDTSNKVAPSGPAAPQMNYFIPAPVMDPNAPMDFLTPTPMGAMPMDPNTQPQTS